jgi:cell wall-associated NlpC family hydrolase
MRAFMKAVVVLVSLVLAMALVGCGPVAGPVGTQIGGETPAGDDPFPPVPAGGDVGDDGPLVAADDAPAKPTAGTNPGYEPPATATQVRSNANVNLRSGPATTYAVLAVIPAGTVVKLLDPTPKNKFLHVEYMGTSGWSHSDYYGPVSTPGPGPTPPPAVDVDGAPSPANALARAKASVGFSYWWGGGAWLAAGSSPAVAGSCSGSCPSCSHSGQYGADCSGMVAKAWQFGVKALGTNSHPYSTVNFVAASSNWSTVSRGALKGGDALVYNESGSGHIAMYEKGDGWGSPTVYECRGCSYGCVYNTRNFASNYKGIRRTGF